MRRKASSKAHSIHDDPAINDRYAAAGTANHSSTISARFFLEPSKKFSVT